MVNYEKRASGRDAEHQGGVGPRETLPKAGS
jgi:hypothetical protein